MRWADIEVPNRLAAMDARRRSACYPQRTFYPLSYGPSTRDHRITKAAFSSARAVALAVKRASTFTLDDRLPTGLSPPLHSSVTLLEETAPVKLTA